jgi:hypothetical protein
VRDVGHWVMPMREHAGTIPGAGDSLCDHGLGDVHESPSGLAPPARCSPCSPPSRAPSATPAEACGSGAPQRGRSGAVGRAGGATRPLSAWPASWSASRRAQDESGSIPGLTVETPLVNGDRRSGRRPWHGGCDRRSAAPLPSPDRGAARVARPGLAGPACRPPTPPPRSHAEGNAPVTAIRHSSFSSFVPDVDERASLAAAPCLPPSRLHPRQHEGFVKLLLRWSTLTTAAWSARIQAHTLIASLHVCRMPLATRRQ